MENTVEKDLINGGHFTETVVEISIEKPTFWQKVRRQTHKKYKVKALVLNDLLKISEIILNIPNIDEHTINELASPAEYYKFIAKNGKYLAEILSIFLNEKKDFILKNFTNADIRDVFMLMTKLANVESFFVCMSLAKQKLTIAKD